MGYILRCVTSYGSLLCKGVIRAISASAYTFNGTDWVVWA